MYESLLTSQNCFHSKEEVHMRVVGRMMISVFLIFRYGVRDRVGLNGRNRNDQCWYRRAGCGGFVQFEKPPTAKRAREK